MPWCPICKNEYIKGMTVCADCDAELVDELPEEIDENEPYVLCKITDEKLASKISTYLNYAGISSAVVVEKEDEFEIIVASFEKDESEKAINFLGNIDEITNEKLVELIPELEEKLDEIENEEANIMFSELRTESSTVYVKQKDKYADYKFSGISFLVFGFLGLGFALANFLKIINFLQPFTLFVISIVFLLFIVAGIFSIVKSSKMKLSVTKEEENVKIIDKWVEENLTEEYIKSLIDDSLSEEENYFNASEKICSKIKEAHPDLDMAYIDSIMDEAYNKYV